MKGQTTLPAIYAPVMSYRGARSYIHSTDLYAELVAGSRHLGLPLDGAVDFRFKRRIETQVEFHFERAESTEAADAAARFMIDSGGQPVLGRIVPTLRPVMERKAYDEKPIWDRATLDAQSVHIRGDSGCAPIEVVTALGVFLHNNVLPLPTGGKWLLSRLSIRRPLRVADALEAAIAIKHVIGRAVTRSDLTGSDGPLGTLEFMASGAAAPVSGGLT